MPEFLKLHSVEDALQKFHDYFIGYEFSSEIISSFDSCGRYLAEAVISEEYLPPFTRSSMDGYAVRAKDTQGASEGLPIYLQIVAEVPMGKTPDFELRPGESALIHTGGMLPPGADAVVILEQSQKTSTNELEVSKSVAAGENVIFKGEDVKPGDIVLPSGRRIRPAEVGGLLALGKTHVKVAKLPRIAVLSSGDEVISPDKTPEPGQIRDVNTGMISALIKSEGGEVVTYPVIPDNREQMERIVKQAYANADALVISAGSSASTRDMTADVIDQLGKPGVFVHGINIRPGKPTILAICDGKPVIGLPGNPVSAMVIAQFFVRPMIRWMQGNKIDLPSSTVKARLEINLPSQAGREEWIPVNVNDSETGKIASPIFFKSNLIFQLAGADGLVRIPRDANGLFAGEDVDVLLF